MRLIHGLALTEMDKLISEGVKVDAIITDPPYGTTACKWDTVIPFDEMWSRLKQLRKERTPIVLFGSEPFSSALRMSNIKEYKYDWIWDKKKGGNPFVVKKQPMKSHENILVFNKHYYNPVMREGKPYKGRKNGGMHTNNFLPRSKKEGFKQADNDGTRYPLSILEYSIHCGSKIHPTQKPVALMEYLIKTYTNEGDTVLDFTMGSGTTGVACKNLNRDFIGIEKDNKYFKIAKERINGE